MSERPHDAGLHTTTCEYGAGSGWTCADDCESDIAQLRRMTTPLTQQDERTIDVEGLVERLEAVEVSDDERAAIRDGVVAAMDGFDWDGEWTADEMDQFRNLAVTSIALRLGEAWDRYCIRRLAATALLSLVRERDEAEAARARIDAEYLDTAGALQDEIDARRKAEAEAAELREALQDVLNTFRKPNRDSLLTATMFDNHMSQYRELLNPQAESEEVSK